MLEGCNPMQNLDLLSFTLLNDWPVLLPIIASSVVLVMVALNRYGYYQKNQCDLEVFVQRWQRELYRSNWETANQLSQQLGGLMGSVAQEGLQLLQTNRSGFAKAFDITINLAVRRLEKGLNILGTIGTVAPYLGLFGTVVRILITFGEMSHAQTAGSGQVMFGIGSALIATAFGLAVAITAVVVNNWFRDKVELFENDFQLLKLVLLSVAEATTPELSTPTVSAKNTASLPV